jgi:hypothetical protein
VRVWPREAVRKLAAPLAWICRKLELHEMGQANVLAIFTPAAAFVLIFLTLCLLLKVARNVAAHLPWRSPW